MSTIASVGYLNTWPLSHFLDDANYTVIRDIPSVVASELDSGNADVALVPVAALFASQTPWRIVPGFCIGSSGPVESVLLVADQPIETWTHVLLDGASRTSAILCQLLLEGPLGRPGLTIERVAPGEAVPRAGGTTAALVIGDDAREVPDQLSVRLDLAEAWYEWTGLPFVFAVWAGRDTLDGEVIAHLRHAAATGLAAVPTQFEGADLTYLTERLRYQLDDQALMGLRRFAALGMRAGFFEQETVELYPPTVQAIPRPEGVDTLLVRAVQGSDLTPEELTTLERHARIADLGAAANMRRQDVVGHQPIPVTLGVKISGSSALESIQPLLDDAVQEGLTECWITVDPTLDLAHYVSLLSALHTQWPSLTIRGFNPADLSRLGPVDDVLLILKGAGLGALDLDDGVLIDDNHEWCDTVRAAAKVGLGGVATARFGGGESASQRAAHLVALRSLQAETGSLSAFVLHATEWRHAAGDGTAANYLRWAALARLALPNIHHHQARWDREGVGTAQAALHGGCDQLATLIAQDADWLIQLIELRRSCEHAGFELSTSRDVPTPKKVRETTRRLLGSRS